MGRLGLASHSLFSQIRLTLTKFLEVGCFLYLGLRKLQFVLSIP